MVFIIKEYSQDDNSRFTDKEFSIFNTDKKAEEYSKSKNIYGIIEAYDKDEYMKFKNSNYDYCDIPEPIEIWDIV